jgi:hypothetical protein
MAFPSFATDRCQTVDYKGAVIKSSFIKFGTDVKKIYLYTEGRCNGYGRRVTVVQPYKWQLEQNFKSSMITR